MDKLVERIALEIGEKLSLRERFELFCERFGGTPIEGKVDAYYPHGEFRGSDGIAVYLMEGQCDGEVPFPPYVTGTHKIPWQRNLNYAVSRLQPGETFSELAMLGELHREKKIDEAVPQYIEKLRALGLNVQAIGPRTPERREIAADDFEDRKLVVVRNDIVTPKSTYVRRQDLARDTFFCAMYEAALSKHR